MKRLLPLLLGIPASFAAGWFLRPAETSGAADDGGLTVVAGENTAATPGPLPGNGKRPFSPLDPPAPLELKPLTSLAELLGIVGDPGSFGDDEMMVVAMMELLPRLMLTDGTTVKGMVEELAGMDGFDRDGKKMLMMGLMFRWMTVNPEEAVGYGLAHPDATSEGSEMNMLGIVYLAKARPETARLLVSLLPEDGREEITQFLTKMEAGGNPSAFLTDPAKSGDMATDDLGGLAAKWMRTDPVAAQAWLESLPAGKREDGEIASEMAGVRLQQDPAAALAWAQGLPDGVEKTNVKDRLVGGILESASNLTEMEAKLTTLPAEWQDGARLEWMAQHARQDGAFPPSQLTEMLAKNPALGTSHEAGRIADASARSFGNSGDFTGGSAWAMGLPPGEAQESAAGSLVATWAEKDAVAASEWITSLPAGATRDKAATSLISEIQQEDPHSALIWAQSLSSEAARTEQTKGVFTHWLENKPLEAIPAIQSLPPAEQARIFKD